MQPGVGSQPTVQCGRNHRLRRRRRRWHRGVLHLRQRPIAQRLQRTAADFKNFGTARAALTHPFQEILQRGHRIGQGIELAATGNPQPANQFGLDVALDAGDVLRRLVHFQDAQRTGNITEQARHIGQPGVIPVGLDEGDKMLARMGEIGDRLGGQHFHRALGLDRDRVLLAPPQRAEAGHLLVQRGIDVQQCAGNLQQQVFVDVGLLLHHLDQGLALTEHQLACAIQPHHRQGVGHRTELVDLGLQGRGRCACAQVQVQRILDAQQLFLDHAADGGQQLAVASGQRTARMLQLLGADIGGFRAKGQQNAFVEHVRAACGTDFIEQRQQHDRNVAVAVLQALQVIRQQHRAAHQHRTGFFGIGYRALVHRVGKQLELFGHQCRRIQLDHAQGALDLMQPGRGLQHRLAVVRLFHIVLDLLAHLQQRLVKLRLDPPQGSMTHRLTRTHGGAPSAM